LTGIDTCYWGTLQAAAFKKNSNCDLSINGLSENKKAACLPQGVNLITWTGNFVSGGFTQCTYNVTVSKPTTATNDLVLSIAATPSVYRQWASNSFEISLKNTGNQSFTNIKIKFPFPDKTVTGGAVIPSTGKWNEWCSGGIKCYEWAIPTLTANTIATLDLPLFILDAVGNITATATILRSTPTDNNAVNNTSSVTITSVLATPQALSMPNRPKPTQLIPIVIQEITPTLSEGDITVLLESIIEKDVAFNFYNTLGKVVKTDIRHVEKGINRLSFDFWNQINGLYFIQTSQGQGRSAPLKFVKL
jgi:hypothetical protein